MAEIIVALDLPEAHSALDLAGRLSGLRWVKVGPTLFVNGGLPLLREMKQRGLRIFLDLKWHDIPHQVGGAAAAAASAGVDLGTVHVLGGAEMLREAGRAAGPMRLVGVTVLTSHSPASYSAAVGRGPVDIPEEVARLASLAMEAGLGGVVAPPLEIGVVRQIVGSEKWIVVPGVRSPGAEAGDQ